MSRESSQLSAGAVVDEDLRLEERLGRGGFATVWRAVNLTTNERVAVKIFHRATLSTNVAQRVRTEADLLLSLHHPNVAGASRVRLDHRPPFIVLELIEGVPMNELLRRRCAQGKHLDLPLVRVLASQLCAAVAFAHDKGVIHRDLKPHNVMISGPDSDVVKLIDLGIARLMDTDADRATTQGRVLGSVFYMAPEQARGEAIDARTDVFALGSLLFELLTLRRAWVQTAEGDNALAFARAGSSAGANAPLEVVERQSKGERPKPSRYRPGLNEAVDRVIARATDADPKQRYGSASALWSELEAALPLADDLDAQNAGDEGLTRLVSRLALDPRALEDTPLALPDAPAPLGVTQTLEFEPSATDLRTPAQRPKTRRGRYGILAFAPLATVVTMITLIVLRWPQSPTPSIVPAEVRPEPPRAVAGPRVLAGAPQIVVNTSTPVRAAPAEDLRPRPEPPAKTRTPEAGRKPTAAASPTERPGETRASVASIVRANALLDRARADSRDVDALRLLREELVQATRTLDDTSRAQKIRRLTESSAMLGDIDGLARAVKQLETALAER